MDFLIDSTNFNGEFKHSSSLTSIIEDCISDAKTYITLNQTSITISLKSKTLENNHLAALNYNTTSESELQIELTVTNDLFEKDQLIQELKKTIVHELIHAFDISVLFENRQLYLESKKFILKNPSSEAINEFDSTRSIQWLFIHFLATLRNEGIALLGQKMIYEEVTHLSENEALSIFENDLQSILTLCNHHLQTKRFSYSEIYALIDSFNQNGYKYADLLLYHLIKGELSISDDYTDIFHLSFKTKQEILAYSIQFDLSEWVHRLFKVNSEMSSVRINYSKIMNLCNFIPVNSSSQTHSILIYGYKNDKLEFIKFIQQRIEIKRSISEIENCLSEYVSQPSLQDIQKDINELANLILQKRSNENGELVDWALSYLFHEKDLLDDSVSFIGLQDDWMVLETTFILIS